MSISKVEFRLFSGPAQVDLGGLDKPTIVELRFGPKGDDGATGATGPAGPNSVTSATTSDGTANLSLSNVSTATATVSGLLTAGHIHGNLAGTLYTHVRTGEAMLKGDPFYISGFHVGSSQPIAMKADASNAAKMPAVGVMDADYANNTSGANGIISGTLSSVNTNGYAVNSPIYVANGGGYSNTAGTIPQQIGITERSNQNTGAFIVTNSKVISFADVSDAETGTATLTLANAVLGNALIVGNGDTVKGRYDIFGNTSHLQWYSDSVLYGERSFTITTENLTSSGEYVYKYPVGNGTIALTGNASGVPDELENGTIQGPTSFKTTSYTYGAGAAAAHRAALGLTTLATTTPGTNVATFLETPTSANLASALTDENGTGGGFVRAEGATLTSPALVGPVNLTSQDASTADRVMTRTLGDARYCRNFIAGKTSETARGNTNTPTSDPSLIIAIPEAGNYIFEVFLRVRTSNSGGGTVSGLKFGLLYSGSATLASSHIGWLQSVASSYARGVLDSFGSYVDIIALNFAENQFTIKGMVTATTAGDFSLSWSPYLVNATETTILKVGSSITMTKTA